MHKFKSAPKPAEIFGKTMHWLLARISPIDEYCNIAELNIRATLFMISIWLMVMVMNPNESLCLQNVFFFSIFTLVLTE